MLAITRAADHEGTQSPAGIFEPGLIYTFSMRACLAEPTEPEPEPTSTDIRFVMKPSYDWIGDTTIDTDWTAVTGTWTADGDPAELQAYLGSTDQATPYTILVDDIMVTTSDAVPPDDVVPGGAIDPIPTPVYAATGSGDVSALTFDDGPDLPGVDELVGVPRGRDRGPRGSSLGRAVVQPQPGTGTGALGSLARSRRLLTEAPTGVVSTCAVADGNNSGPGPAQSRSCPAVSR